MKRIERGERLFAVYDNLASISKGFHWHGKDTDSLQVASMAHDKGKVVTPHLHKFRPRSVEYTQECVVLVQGKIEFSFYDYDKVFLDKVTLNPGDAVTIFGGYHGLKVLEDNSVYFEIKNGPFIGNEGDKEFIETF